MPGRILEGISDTFLNIFDVYVVGFLEWFAQLIGPALVMFALVIIATCTYVFFAYIVPFYDWSTINQLCVITLGLFLLFNALFNYYKCVTVCAGTPPSKAEVEEAGECSALGNRLWNPDVCDEEEGGRIRYKQTTYSVCGKCDRIRPPRTHHCSVCKSCVLKMDHHCPWIYNCVGYRNQKFFYLFLLHVFLVDVFFIVTSWAPAMNAFNAPYADTTRPWIVLTFVIASVLSIAIGAFLAFHTYLILRNLTTLEFMVPDRDSRSKTPTNPYDLGYCGNWQSVFGSDTGPIWTLKWSLSFLHKDEVHDVTIPPFDRKPHCAHDANQRPDLVPPKE